MGIAVLGPLEVDGGNGALARRDRVVLAVLAMRAGEVVPADQLADALWPEGPPATWSKALQGTVVRLRKLLGAAAIETVGHGYRLALPPSEIDAHEFERLMGRSRELLELGEPERAGYGAAEALGLWRGTPLADLEEWEPGRTEADRLEELHRDAEELRVDAALRSGRHGEVLGDARRLVEQAPLRERRWELLALAQYRAGQQADALRSLQQLRRVLVSELGLDPGPEVLALEQAILRQDPDLLPLITVAEPSETCPYLGLVPYGVGDAETFFGREAEVEACRRRLPSAGVVAVVGPSGSGKSSLVRAGLAAALERDGERVVVITPGRHPLAALSAVPPRGPPVVVVVDQAEEAVSLCEDSAEVGQFFEALAAHAAGHATGGGLVLALRADRLGDLVGYGEMSRLVEQGLYLLTPMTAESLRAAIEGPARQAGLRLEPGLVELLVAEVEGQPGALPLLSHALRQTWERREGGVLTLEGYRATGGIRQAVARSAERVYEELPLEQRTMLRDVMLRLVTPSPEGAPMRSRVPRRLLSTDPAHDQLMERLVAARLVTSDDGVVELAHEAIARAWPRLQGWLDDDTEGQRVLRHLSVAADTWDTMGRPDDELYRGTRLAQALEWRARAAPDLTPVEVDHLTAAERRARQEEQSALEQARSQARVNRRLRGLLVGAAMLLVAAMVAGILAVRQANRAADATETAVAQRAAAQAQLAGTVDRALALAAAAHHVEQSSESRAGLLAALARIPQLSAVRPRGGVFLEASPDGRTLVTLDTDHRFWFHDTSTLELVGGYDPYPDRDVHGITSNGSHLAFDADGTRLAVALLDVTDGVVEVLDPATYEPVAAQPGGQPDGALPIDVKLSADGRYLAVSVALLESSAGQGHWVYVWDLTRPEQPLRRIEMPSDTFHIDFSHDGRLLYAAPGSQSGAAGTGLRVYDVRTGQLTDRRGGGGQGLELSPDGRTLAYGQGDEVFLSDAATGDITHRLRGAEGVARIAFSTGGRLVAAVSDAAYVWETHSGRLLEKIPLEAPTLDLAFDTSGDRLFVPSDGRLLALDLTGANRYVQRISDADPDPPPVGTGFRYASPYVPIAARNGPITTSGRVNTLEDLQFEPRRTGGTTARLGLSGLGNTYDSHAWSPDRRHLAYGDPNGRMRIVDWRAGTEIARRRFPVRQLAYTSDGTRILAGRPSGLVMLDARTLRETTELLSLPDRLIIHADAGPGDDTAVVVTAQDTGAARDLFTVADRWLLIDLQTGDTLREGRLHASASSMAVSPDRTRMAAASDGAVEVVDLRSGESTVSTETSTAAKAEGGVTFSPDGALLASADVLGDVSLWDGTTGAPLGTVHVGEDATVPVFLDNRQLLLPYPDGSTFVWDTSAQYAVDTACRILGRGLSREEWRVAFGDRPFEEVCG